MSDTYRDHWLATGDDDTPTVLCDGSGEPVPEPEVVHGLTAGGSEYIGACCWHCGRLVDTVPPLAL